MEIERTSAESGIKMKITAQPEEGFQGILNAIDDIPIIVGKGNTNYRCGNCDNALYKNVDVGQVSGFQSICPKCGCQNGFE